MTSSPDSTAELQRRLLQDGLLSTTQATLTPLTGGVSSDIYRVQDGDRCFVVKQALAKLRVQDDWQADLSRNDFERAYMAYVAKLEPQAVPQLLGGGQGYFAMEFLGEGFANWKQLLLEGECLTQHAALASRTLGRIHAASTGDAEAELLFASTENFRQLRTDPYLRTTGDRHPELRGIFHTEADRLEATRECLVHGDYSPKNLLIREDRLVILDSEVAWYGDGAFDLAFLLNHLLLKALFHSSRVTALPELVAVAQREYVQARALPAAAQVAFDHQTAWLLLMLLLARVDGKSPVEYLSDAQQAHLRAFVCPRLQKGNRSSVAELADAWFTQLPNT